MVARKFTVLLEPAEEGGFIVKCVELPVASQGETKKEALRNIKEAIEGYLEVKAKLGEKDSHKRTEIVLEVEDTTGETVVKRLPKVYVSKEEKEDIERSVQEMKKGNFVAFNELKDA